MNLLALRRRPAIDLAVDVGFATLLILCGIRYFSRHTLDGVGLAALVLAAGAGASYAVAVIGTRGIVARTSSVIDAIRSRQSVGLLLATAFWLPLVVLAPSFGWCAFALFFAVHRVLRGRLATAISAVIVIAVSTGLFLMSDGDDLGLVLGPFFGGLVLTYAYAALDRALTEQQELITELVETRQQLAASERDAGALAERERVASELHDTVVQHTATALLMLESDGLRPGRQSQEVTQARNALREGLVETRQLLHGLTDPRTSVPSLAAALAAQAELAGANFSIAGNEREIEAPVSHAMQRIVQEALTNARKHANSASVHVTLTFFDEAIGADITDEGEGFRYEPGAGDVPVAVSAESGGFGIRAMAWRAETLGGSLTIESRPGDGTVVAAIIPTPTEPS